MIKPDINYWNHFKSVNGALSCAESLAIMNIAAQAPLNGLWLEMGVYKGKSALSALYGGSCNEFHLVDTEFEKEIPTSEVVANISAYTKDKIKVTIIIGESLEYLANTNNMYSYVFSDAGSHQDGLPMTEVKYLEDRIIPNGIICFHDFDSQFKEVRECYDYLLGTGKYEEIPINWQEITQHIDENNIEEGNISWHHNELKNPNFVGALRRK